MVTDGFHVNLTYYNLQEFSVLRRIHMLLAAVLFARASIEGVIIYYVDSYRPIDGYENVLYLLFFIKLVKIYFNKESIR